LRLHPILLTLREKGGGEGRGRESEGAGSAIFSFGSLWKTNQVAEKGRGKEKAGGEERGRRRIEGPSSDSWGLLLRKRLRRKKKGEEKAGNKINQSYCAIVKHCDFRSRGRKEFERKGKKNAGKVHVF